MFPLLLVQVQMPNVFLPVIGVAVFAVANMIVLTHSHRALRSTSPR
jgi:hypothetical protein